MVENKGYVPSLTEWDELVLLWNRSRTVMASTLAPSVKARIAWTAKQFVDAHPLASGHLVYAWLERNLEIAAGPAPISSETPAGRWHDEPTAEHKYVARGTPHAHTKDHTISKPVVARGPGRG